MADGSDSAGHADQDHENHEGHDWPVLDSRVEYETGWYDGGYDLVEQPDGTEKRYYWADLPPAVVVIALDGDDVVFVDQYRPAIREQCLELPAGIVEKAEADDGADAPRPNEDREPWAIAGARELREETGFAADEATHVQTVNVATGVLRHKRGYVVAEGLTRMERELDENEFLTVERVPAADAIATARESPANDATLEGLLLAAADGFL